MSSVDTPTGERAKSRLTADELRELQNTFKMRGLMPREQARLLAHVEAVEEELRALRGLAGQAGRLY